MSSSSGASKKKQQDEQNLKILRELAALLPNKQCFDCHQRGPTYVNMTIGSFVCTSCSGLLRGLNPPHRVKSISMAIFTGDEIELLKSRGNEYCRRVWIGRYDRGGRSPLEDGVSKDETQMKDHLATKYEKKRWYVSPSEAFANSPAPTQQIPSSSSSQNNAGTTPATGGVTQSMGAPRSHSSNIVAAPPSSTTHPPNLNRPTPPQQQSSDNNNHDLFSRNPQANPSSSSADIIFDPFGTSSGFGSSVSSPSGSLNQQHPPPTAAASNGVFQGLQPNHGNIVDGGGSGASTVPKSATVPAGFLVPSGQLQPITTQQQQHQQNQQQQPKQGGGSGGDKYSALAELDDLFRSSSPVDTNLGNDKRQPAPTSTGIHHPPGAFPPLQQQQSNPNQFYPTRPPPVSSSANSSINPFATNSLAASAGGQFFGQAPATSNVGQGHGGGGGYAYFPTSSGAVNSQAQMQGYHRPPQQQQHHQFQQQQQPPMTQMPPINPFSGPMTNPRPATGTATSWNPFL